MANLSVLLITLLCWMFIKVVKTGTSKTEDFAFEGFAPSVNYEVILPELESGIAPETESNRNMFSFLYPVKSEEILKEVSCEAEPDFLSFDELFELCCYSVNNMKQYYIDIIDAAHRAPDKYDERYAMGWALSAIGIVEIVEGDQVEFYLSTRKAA